MWTCFIGIGLGVLEIVLLKKSVAMMSQDKSNIPLGVILTVGKLAVILGVLYMIARFISLTAMIWCAGGLAATMIIIPVITGLRAISRYKHPQQGEK